MSPTPDPAFLTNLLFALVLACAAIQAPDPGPHADTHTTVRRHAGPAFVILSPR